MSRYSRATVSPKLMNKMAIYYKPNVLYSTNILKVIKGDNFSAKAKGPAKHSLCRKFH